MTDQPEAMRLADELEMWTLGEPAAAELRRLSIENEALGLHLSERMKDLARVEAQRDALLEALRWIADRCPVHLSDHPLHNIHKEMSHDAGARARAAIKAAEGENYAKNL